MERADGTVQPLGHIAQVEMQAGDAFVIETPGGGGYGAAEVAAAERRSATMEARHG